jgi:hypothetical protein
MGPYVSRAWPNQYRPDGSRCHGASMLGARYGTAICELRKTMGSRKPLPPRLRPTRVLSKNRSACLRRLRVSSLSAARQPQNGADSPRWRGLLAGRGRGQMQPNLFRDRPEAGPILAERLGRLVPGSESLVLALPRGGWVSHEVARSPLLPVDVFPVRDSDCRGGRNWRVGHCKRGMRSEPNAFSGRCNFLSPLIDQLTRREAKKLKRGKELYVKGSRRNGNGCDEESGGRCDPPAG